MDDGSTAAAVISQLDAIEAAVRPISQMLEQLHHAVEAFESYQSVGIVAVKAARRLAARSRLLAAIARRREGGDAVAGAFDALARKADLVASKLETRGVRDLTPNASPRQPARRVLCLTAPGSPQYRSVPPNLGRAAAA
jgi:hypothetical protein